MKQHAFNSRFKPLTFVLLTGIALIAIGYIGMARAAAPGDLDPTFDGDGVVYTDIQTNLGDMAFGVAVQASDGKVVAVGESNGDFAVARYNNNGSPDSSFSGDGLATTAVSANLDTALAVAIEDDGQIVAAGYQADGAGTPIAFAVVRYNANGTLDSGFGTSGIFTDTLGGAAAEATAVAIQDDGKIVVAGTVDGDFAVARLNANNGNLDSGFNSIGYNITDVSGSVRTDEAHGLVIQSSGKIVLGGFTDLGDHQDFALARYTSSGSLDTATFGLGGTTHVDVSLNPAAKINDLAYGLGQQPDGKLILAGYLETGDATNKEDIGLARFSVDGVLDTSFGSSGTTITARAGTDWTYGVAIQPTGKIIVAGFTNNTPTNEDFQLARYHSDGSLDTTFGVSGFVNTDIGTVVSAGNDNSQDEAYAVALHNDKIVVAGLTDVPLGFGDMNFAVARYDAQNAPPTVSDFSKIADEDTGVLFTALDFTGNFTDTNGDALMLVKVLSLPANGTLDLDGTAVIVNQEIPAAELDLLVFSPDANWYGDTSFGWNGTDGLDYAATAASVNISITNINDAPSFTLKSNPDQAIDEDAGLQTVNNFVTSWSAGPNEDGAGGQTVDFLVSNDNMVLFAVQPAIDGNGTLTYTPADDRFGTATVTVRAHDDGGTAGGGQDTSAAQTFTVDISAINDAPSFTGGGNVTVNEDAGSTTVNGWATDISAGPFEMQVIDFTVTNNNNSLFDQSPDVAAINGDLTFTPNPDVSGSATVTVTLSDDSTTNNTSAPYVFTLTINPVNDAPSFTMMANPDQALLEDAGPQTVNGFVTGRDPGAADESGQTVSIVITTTNDAIFTALPEVDAVGQLTYTPAANANGSVTVYVRAMDDGGRDFGGVDTSPAQTFMIDITAVNDAPSFTSGGDLFVDEEFAAFGTTEAGWATNIQPGPPDESGQTLIFNLSTDNDALFTVLPAIDPDTGDLTFTAVGGSDDSAVVTVTLSDDGGTANGGVAESAPQTFTITVTFINDPPTFNAGPNQTVDEDAGAQSVVNWATNIDPGSPTETGQVLTFQTSNDNNALFVVQPSVDETTGDLTYTPAVNANGAATVTVALSDDGGTANGGDDTSDPQTFTITVNPINDQPTLTDFAVNGSVNKVIGFSAASFETAFADVDGDSLSRVKVTSLPANGTLALNGTAVSLNQEILAANLSQLTFTPDSDWNGMTSFTWNGSDGTAYAALDASVNITISYNVFLPIVIAP